MTYGRFLHGDPAVVDQLIGEEVFVALVMVNRVPLPVDVVDVWIAPSKIGGQRGRFGDLMMGPVLEAVNASIGEASPWPSNIVAEMKSTGAVLVVRNDPSLGAYRVLSVAKGSSDRLADAGREVDIPQLRLLLNGLET